MFLCKLAIFAALAEAQQGERPRSSTPKRRGGQFRRNGPTSERRRQLRNRIEPDDFLAVDNLTADSMNLSEISTTTEPESTTVTEAITEAATTPEPENSADAVDDKGENLDSEEEAEYDQYEPVMLLDSVSFDEIPEEVEEEVEESKTAEADDEVADVKLSTLESVESQRAADFGIQPEPVDFGIGARSSMMDFASAFAGMAQNQASSQNEEFSAPNDNQRYAGPVAVVNNAGNSATNNNAGGSAATGGNTVAVASADDRYCMTCHAYGSSTAATMAKCEAEKTHNLCRSGDVCLVEVRERYGEVIEFKTGCKAQRACLDQQKNNFVPPSLPMHTQCRPEDPLTSRRFGASVCRQCFLACEYDAAIGNGNWCFKTAVGIPTGSTGIHMDFWSGTCTPSACDYGRKWWDADLLSCQLANTLTSGSDCSSDVYPPIY